MTSTRERRAGLAVEWERRSELPLTVGALLFLLAYALPILDTSLSEGTVRLCRAVTWATWAMLVADVIVRLLLAPRRLAFAKANVLDIAAAVLPILRPLRLLRLVRLLSAMNRFAGSSVRGRVGAYVLGSVVLVVFVSSLAVLDAERRDPDANITSYGDAVWWVMTTLSTVGYGDHYPVTTTGRCVAVALMVIGVGLLGIVTASLASWLIDQVREIEEDSSASTAGELEALASEVRALRAHLESGTTQPPDPAQDAG